MNTAEFSTEFSIRTTVNFTSIIGTLERYTWENPHSNTQVENIVILDISNLVQITSVNIIMRNLVSVEEMDSSCKLASNFLAKSRFVKIALKLEMKNSVEPIDIKQQNINGYIIGSNRNWLTFFLYGEAPEPLRFASDGDDNKDSSSSKFNTAESVSIYQELGDPIMEVCGLCNTVPAPINRGDVSKFKNSSWVEAEASTFSNSNDSVQSVILHAMSDTSVASINRMRKNLKMFRKLCLISSTLSFFGVKYSAKI